MKKLSIVIVNYNVRHYLDQCLKSVYASEKHCLESHPNLKIEIWVVDNASVDGSVDFLKQNHTGIQLIANKENHGFSKANNQAIRQSTSEYVLLLNPDTIIQEDTLKEVIEFMDAHQDAGGLGVQMLDGQGKFLPESKRGLPNPWVAFFKIFGFSSLFPKSRVFGRYHLGFLDKDLIHEVDVLSGAFMMMRRVALEKAGLLDEDYFMYGEDIDLSYKITQSGFKNYYTPKTRIIHYKGESTKKSSVNYVLVFYRAMAIFAKKNLSQSNAILFSVLIHLAIYARASMAILRRLLSQWLVPIWDAIFLYGGMFYQKRYWENNHKYIDGGSYPEEYHLYYMPAYIAIWLIAIWMSGGYDKPIRGSRLIRGVGLGTIAILVVYSLLPEDMRTSRALILLGAVWAVISFFISRSIFHFLGVEGFEFDGGTRKVAILGNKPERQRVDELIRKYGDRVEIVGHIGIGEELGDEEYLGNVENLKEIIDIFQINELVIGGDGLSAEEEIEWMAQLEGSKVEIRIAPADGGYIIGSQTIRGSMEGGSESLVQITTATSRRNKRIFDVIYSMLILIISPILVLIGTKIKLYRNTFAVLSGRKNWVGFIGKAYENKAVLTLEEIIPKHSEVNQAIFNQLNLQYARHYSPLTDLNIILKNLRKLGD